MCVPLARAVVGHLSSGLTDHQQQPLAHTALACDAEPPCMQQQHSHDWLQVAEETAMVDWWNLKLIQQENDRHTCQADWLPPGFAAVVASTASGGPLTGMPIGGPRMHQAPGLLPSHQCAADSPQTHPDRLWGRTSWWQSLQHAANFL